MYYENDNLHIEEDDQCVTCENFTKGIACPLIQAIASGFVALEGDMVVTNCGFYKEFKRHLKLVKESNN